MDPLTLTSVLSLFNPYINITSQSSLQHQYHFIICNLYNSPLCDSTPVLPGYLLLRHSCTWDRTSTLWSCQIALPCGYCECFYCGLYCLVGAYVRLQPTGPKRQAGGTPLGLQTPGAWLPGLGVWQATLADRTLGYSHLVPGLPAYILGRPCAHVALGLIACVLGKPSAHVAFGLMFVW